VLPHGVPRVAIEAAHPMSWYQLAGRTAWSSASSARRLGPVPALYQELGLTVDKLVDAAKQVMQGR
jgi:transketolase